MYFYTYKVVLLKGTLAGKYYYGQHKTKKLEDGYIASGRKVCSYFSKYPRIEGVTYTRQILAFYNDEDELNRAEEILVGDLYKTDPNCLNLKAGGNIASSEILASTHRGKTYKKREPLPEERKKRISEANKGRKRSEETRKKIAENNRRKASDPEYRKKLSLAATGRKYPGRTWTKDPVTGKRIYKIEK